MICTSNEDERQSRHSDFFWRSSCRLHIAALNNHDLVRSAALLWHCHSSRRHDNIVLSMVWFAARGIWCLAESRGTADPPARVSFCGTLIARRRAEG